MAYPYLIGPGGQPFIIQQVPLIQQQVSVIPQQQVLPQQTQPVPPKVPDYMSEEKLQEKGKNEEESKFYTKCVYVLLLYLVLPFCSLDNLFDWISSRMCCNLCLEPLIIYYLYTPDYLHLHVKISNYIPQHGNGSSCSPSDTVRRESLVLLMLRKRKCHQNMSGKSSVTMAIWQTGSSDMINECILGMLSWIPSCLWIWIWYSHFLYLPKRNEL